MASTNKTTNYELNQWLGNDYIKREDFNNDNELIDSALKANADAITSEAAARAAGDNALEDLVSSNLTKRNLLHNWDFRNPVNQRGATSYTGISYFIDRWRIPNGTITAAVVSGGIQLSSTSASGLGMFEQKIEFPEQYAGLAITLSFKIKAITSGVPVAVLIVNGSVVSSVYASGAGIYSVSYTLPSTVTSISVYINRQSAVTSDFIVESVKLELGFVSTLVNDPPADYGEQLALCQRYVFKLDNYQRIRACRVHQNMIEFFIETPTTMRIAPTLTDSASVISIMEITASTTYTGFTLSAVRLHPNGFSLDYTKSSHGLSDAILFISCPGGSINAPIFSAEL